MNCTPSYDLYAHRLPDNVCPVSVSLWSLQHMHLSPASLWWHIKGKGYKIQDSCHRKKFGTSRNGIKSLSFLAVQNSSIGDPLIKDFTDCHTKNNPIDFRPPRHLIRVIRRHVLTYKKTETMTKTKTNTTKTPFENLRFWEPTDNRQEPPWPCQHWLNCEVEKLKKVEKIGL